MPFLLVQLVDETDEDFFANAQRPKRGDVRSVHEHANSWGPWFRNNPDWRIVEVKGTLEEACLYLTPEVETDPKNPSRTLQYRDRKVDVDALEDGMSMKALKRATTRKSRIEDPHVFGGSPRVF